MLTETLKLIKSLDSGVVDGDVEELVELARLNKVLLGFLRRVSCEGSLRAAEESRYEQYVSEVAGVLKRLEGLDYALFKFRKPVEHVSVDIDVLVRSEHLQRAVRELRKAGFITEVIEPYTVTMVKGRTIVDLYTYPSFAWVVYLDGERLLEEVEDVKVEGIDNPVRALTKEAEVVVVAAHAIYKEHIYLLADYYVVKHWLSGRALRLAEELRATEAIRESLELNNQIERGMVEAPVNLSLTKIAKILTTKFVRDSNFRATSLNTIKLMTRKRTINQLVSRMRRKSY